MHSYESAIETLKPEILILVETHLTGRCGIKIPNYRNILLCNRKEVKGGGLLAAVRDDTNISMIMTEMDSEKGQMWIKIKTQSWSCNLGIVYGLHECRSTENEIDDWFFKLESSLAKYSDESIILVGDMNAYIGNDDKGIDGNHQEINKNGKWWRELIDRRNFTLINSCDRCTGKWTRKSSSNGKESILDLVVCNELMCSNVKKMSIDETGKWTISRFRNIKGKTIETPSDHNPILIELASESAKNITREKVWRITEDSLRDFKLHTDNIHMKETWSSGGDVNVKYNRWFKQLKGIMYQKFTRATKKNKMKSKAIKGKIKVKNNLKRELQKAKNSGLSGGILESQLNAELTNILEDIGEEIQNEKREKIQKRMERITSKSSTATNEIWKVRKNVLTKSDQRMAIDDINGNILTNKENILERHNEYYRELLKTREPEPEAEEINREIEKQFEINMENKLYDADKINSTFTEDELDKVISKLKAHKCPGRDQITNEILKSAGKNLKASMLKMFNWFLTEEIIPVELTKIHIKTIYKGKGKVSSLLNHRGVFLGSEIIKFYEKLIYNRINPHVEEGQSEFQAGGRRQRSIADHVFILRSILQHYKYINKQLLIEFLDLIKAFDKMSLKHILNDLWRCDVRGKIWRIIYKINSNSNISIKTAMGSSPEFNINESLKQGSVLATSLAALHTDTITKLFSNEGLGVMYGNLRINCLLFQDDIVKIETSSHNLNVSNEIMTHFRQMNLMEFHPDKSKYINTEVIEENIKLGNTEIKLTDNYAYLGDILTADNRLKETIDLRSKTCTATVAELNAIIEETVAEDILIDAVITYHKAIIIPKLCLNSETWNITQAEMEDLERIQNKSLKRMLRFPQGTPSRGLTAELGIMTVESVISEKRLKFLHRVLNQPDTNITRKVLMEQKGLPEETWLKNTVNMCHDLSLPEDLDVIASMSKEQWSNQVKKAIEMKEEKSLHEWMFNSKKYNSTTINVRKKKYINYLPPSLAITMLKTRLGMIELKPNYKNLHQDTNCRKCNGEEETLQHVLKCYQGSKASSATTINEVEEIVNKVEVKDQNLVRNLAADIMETLLQLRDDKVLVPEVLPESTLDTATSSEEDMA